jgi:hypothetical protein
MKRTDIIQALINITTAKNYLEVGISNGANIKRIVCENKVSVDPEPLSNATHVMNSDDFFKQNKKTFDVIFLDGLHLAEQLEKDILNSLEVLNEGGYIVCHDINPEKEEHQVRNYIGGTWNGDVWKAFVSLRSNRDDLYMITVDTDYGCAVITRGKQEKIEVPLELTFSDLVKNRKNWLNLISPREFEEEFGCNDLKSMLKAYIQKPNNPEANWNLALYYDEIGQTATAVSFYIRTAERTTDDLIKYEALIRTANCFEKQGTRRFTVKNIMKHAITVQPHRPEGYYILSKAYEHDTNNDGRWFDSYTMASIGLSFSDSRIIPLSTDVDYPGKHSLLFQKAHSAWWCGLGDDSRNMFLDLYANYELGNTYKQAVYENLVKMNVFSSSSLTLYNNRKHDKLKTKFEGSEGIIQNYSEAYQDMFVLTLLNGKKNGSYVEIGSGHPTYGNNTYLLEKDFGWKGVSLDISEDFVKAHNDQRSHTCVLKDATTVNYSKFLDGLGFGNDIDYLQIDCDPPSVSYQVLLSIPFDSRRFGIITFEHDHYTDPNSGYREKARKYLESYGYKLFVSNISPDKNRPYEDWFVHPELININAVRSLENTSDRTKMAEDYMMGTLSGNWN